MRGLRVLVVDDEPPALAELTYQLDNNDAVAAVMAAPNGADALRILQAEAVDAVFLDIRMPGLDGMELARVLARFARSPQVVFVTAYEEFAVDAFDLKVCDYLLKPVREDRLARAVRRVLEARAMHPEGAAEQPAVQETIPVELGGVTRFVARGDVRYAEAQGDYVRLHTAHGSYLVRVSLATLEEQWSDAGFARIHRSYLVALRHIDQLRWDGGRMSVRIGSEVLQVSRRHTRELRDRLVRGARPGSP